LAPSIESVTSSSSSSSSSFSSSSFSSSSSSSSSNSYSLSRSLQSTLILISSFRIHLFWLLSRADWKLLTGVSNNV